MVKLRQRLSSSTSSKSKLHPILVCLSATTIPTPKQCRQLGQRVGSCRIRIPKHLTSVTRQRRLQVSQLISLAPPIVGGTVLEVSPERFERPCPVERTQANTMPSVATASIVRRRRVTPATAPSTMPPPSTPTPCRRMSSQTLSASIMSSSTPGSSCRNCYCRPRPAPPVGIAVVTLVISVITISQTQTITVAAVARPVLIT